MRWFDVKFSGCDSFDGGQEYTFRATVRATDPNQAVRKVVGAKFGLDYWRVTHDYSNIGRMIFAIEDGGRFYKTIHTSYRAMDEIVTEVTDPARVARLDGAPELLFLEGEDAATKALTSGMEEVNPPSWASLWPAPDAYQAQCLETWGSAADTPREQRLHALLGLAGEVGEVANLVKKQLYKPGVVADNAAVIDELADVAYYLATLALLYGVTFDGLFAHLAGKLAGGHGWVSPSNLTEAV